MAGEQAMAAAGRMEEAEAEAEAQAMAMAMAMGGQSGAGRCIRWKEEEE